MSHRRTPAHVMIERKRDQWLRRERRRTLSVRPHFELLESRRLLSFVVTSTADSGAGSLRQAILDVNAAPAGTADLITFDIGSGVQTIRPLSALTVTNPVDLDGAAPPNFPTQVIVISGTQAGSTDGLVIAGGTSIVENLVINGFTSGGNAQVNRNGILLETNGGDMVEGCMIGTNASGTQSVPNDTGIGIQASTSDTIGGTTAAERNIISGNNDEGIAIADTTATGNLIEGNYIGTDPTGKVAVGNLYGILLTDLNNGGLGFSSATTIGGTAFGAGNVISGNDIGVEFYHSGNNLVLGNSIGVTADGDAGPGNTESGIVLLDTSNNTIGGANDATGDAFSNVISGNGQTNDAYSGGVAILGKSSGNLVQNNTIGTDSNALTSVPNTPSGVRLDLDPQNATLGVPRTTPSAAPQHRRTTSFPGTRARGSVSQPAP